MASKDLVAGGFGLQSVRPGQCDQAPAADRSGRQQVPQRRRRLAAGRQASASSTCTPPLVDLPSAQLTGVVSGQDLTHHATVTKITPVIDLYLAQLGSS
jgi:hypothetical protein